MRVFWALAYSVIAAPAVCWSCDPDFVVVAGERLVFHAPVHSRDAGNQERLARFWEPNRGTDPTADSPFLDGVEFGWFGAAHMGILARKGGVYTNVTPQNIGAFLSAVKTTSQAEAVITVLHPDWQKARLGPRQLARVLRDVDSSANRLPLKVVSRRFDTNLISRGCFQDNGIWMADFALMEGASVHEYKYAIDTHNRLAYVTHLLVDGPREKQVFAGTGVAGPPPRTTFDDCREFLLASAGKEANGNNNARKEDEQQKSPKETGINGKGDTQH